MPDLIQTNLTFGFEAEWARNIDGLLSHLASDGYLPTDEMHRYHCECEYCDLDSPYMLRAQTDSTCSGELISIPFVTAQWDSWQYLLDRIETHAVDADAEPGVDAGFHVHVRNTQPLYHAIYNIDLDGGGADQSLRKFLVLCLVMPLFSDIAFGRHSEGTDLNVPFNRFIANCFSANGRRYRWPDTPRGILSEGIEANRVLLTNVLRTAYDSDRHADVSLNTRYDTTEYRLWRSTRSAWRMRLYVLASVMLNSPGFHEAVPTWDIDWNNGTYEVTTEFIDCVDRSGQALAQQLAADMATQHDYIHKYLRTHPLPPAYSL